jgi:hypothetical protein
LIEDSGVGARDEVLARDIGEDETHVKPLAEVHFAEDVQEFLLARLQNGDYLLIALVN